MENLKPFDGLHCETTATGTLLKHIGIELSEPMLFGLGEGLGFIYWKMKTMDFPFLSGRIKTDLLTQHICKNLGLELNVHETSSKVKAWQAVRQLLDEGQPVGLKLDAYYLEYFANPFHFAGHYVAIYGYVDEHAYLVDTRQQGGNVKTSLASLALARAEKGPMSSKNLYYTIAGNMENVDLKEVLIAAMVKNAKQYLAPPISNFQNPCHKREKCNGNIGFIRIGHLNEKNFCSNRFNRFSLKINNKLNLKRVYIQFVINYIDLICEIEINLALYCSVSFGVTLYQECLRACSPALCRWLLRFQTGRL